MAFCFSNMRVGSRFLSFCFDNCLALRYGNVWCRHLAIARALNYVTGNNLLTCDTIAYIFTGWQHRFTFWGGLLSVQSVILGSHGWGCCLFLITGVGGRVGLSAQWIDHLFTVACSGPEVNHIRNTLAMVPLYEMAITDRLVSTAASNLLRCFTLTLVAMNSDSYILLKHDATLLYIYWTGHITAVMSYHGLRVLSFEFNGPRLIMSLSIFCILCGYYVHVNSWYRVMKQTQ